jgi:hypothetical protein
MPGMRDSRFGQFADPNFGATLSHASAGAPGVLPQPDQAGPSASAQPSYAPPAPPRPASQPSFGPGLLPQGGGNPGSIYLAEGGVIPEGQDSGDAAPAQADPFGMIQQALSYGRKKLGLPENFFGQAKPKSSNDAAATNQAAKDEGATGNLQDDDLRAFQNNQINNNLQPGEQGQWGDTTLEGKEKTAYLAEGGAIEDDTGTGDDEQGVIPDGSDDQSQSQEQGSSTPSGSSGNPQAAMTYLSGQGAVPPEVAAGLERQVDPQGRMDPNLRKMLAVAQAGSPDKAFQVLQHYRQKFNALNAFAKAAAQGAGGRPPDLRASAHAATQAYQHLPDGNAVNFQPVQGGMRVAVRKLIPSKPAPSGGEDNSQTQGQPQMFEEGGAVEQEDQAQPDMPEYATAGQDKPDVMPAYGDKQQAPHEMLRDFVLSIPQYLGWLSKDGQADSVFDKGVDTTLADASKQQPAGGAMNPMNTGPALQQPQQQLSMSTPRTRFEAPPQQPQFHRATPPDAQAFGAKTGAAGGQQGDTLADVLHEIDQAYPSVGMSQQRALARAAARQEWAKNNAKILQEQTKGVTINNVTDKKIEGKHQDVQTHETEATGRSKYANDQKASTADKTIAARASEGEKNRGAAMDRAVVINKPSTLNSPENFQRARGNAERPQQQSGSDLKLVNGKWYKRGPNGEAVEVQGPAQ